MPRLLIVRHAIALEREEAQSQQMSDADRPLTDKGRRRMQQAAAGIQQVAGPLRQILSSPLRRAQQTAAILAREYPGSACSTTDALSPGSPSSSLITELDKVSEQGSFAIVGHEPELSALIATLMFGESGAAIQMKKGGAALLDFPNRIVAGQGTLLWLLTPGQLRKLGNETS
jgi:phosphohistidine phosphatase